MTTRSNSPYVRPDLLIIGEIRDKETARAVVRTSLTESDLLYYSCRRSRCYEVLELGVSEEELKIVYKVFACS